MLTVVKMQKVKLSKLSADSVKESAHGGRENYRQADERSGAQRAHRWPEGCCRKWFAARPSGTENLYKNRMKLPMSRGRSGSGCPLAAQPGMHCDAVSLVRRARRSRTR